MSVGQVLGTPESQGRVTFPGILQIQRASYTRSQGIQPGICTIDMVPQNLEQYPLPFNGELVFEWRESATDVLASYSSLKIEMPGCRLDRASLQRSQNGEVWRVPILDRRWKWAFGSFSGHWNVKVNGRLETRKIKTPYELAELCLEAMGEKDYDIDDLKVFDVKRSEMRPEVHWDRIPPAQALEELANAIGYRICLGWDDKVRLREFGDGEVLPDGAIMVRGFEQDFPERPDSVTVVGGISYHEAFWELEAVGKDIDDEWKPMDHLSYIPVLENGAKTWQLSSPPDFEGILATYKELDEGKKPTDADVVRRKEQLQLARETAWKCYRLKYPAGTVESQALRNNFDSLGRKLGEELNKGLRRGDNRSIDRLYEQYEEARRKLFKDAKPVVPGPKKINPRTKRLDDYELEEFEQILPCFATRAELGVDPYTGELVRKPVQIRGEWYDSMFCRNTPFGYRMPDDQFEVMPELGIIKFKQPIRRSFDIEVQNPSGNGTSTQTRLLAARLTAVIATPVKSLEGEALRYEYKVELQENLKAGTGTQVLRKNEIVLSHQARYSVIDKPVGNTGKTQKEWKYLRVLDNVKEELLEEQAVRYIIIRKLGYFMTDTGAATYGGMVKQNIDGAILQVSISLDTSGGMITSMSRNFEAQVYEPSYDERKRADALKQMIKDHEAKVNKTEQVEPKGKK